MSVQIDRELFERYNIAGPRYTSYPTALEFKEGFGEEDILRAASASEQQFTSLYVHIPFCHQLCYYCGCNKQVTKKPEKADVYLDYLLQEISLRSHIQSDKPVNQLHFGGGTPSFMSPAQLGQIVGALRTQFEFLDGAEISIEIDPRSVDTAYLSELKAIGFNRLSFGVQDVDEDVQIVINRVQSTEHIAELITHAKAEGFESISVDLIYGLPKQSLATFKHTIDAVVAMPIDRVSLFSYAHLPSRFPAQKLFKPEWLPSAELKTDLMMLAIERLNENGFDSIGLDHFARSDDELAVAAREGRLHRNFQGYTLLDEADLLGFGVSSISTVGASFAQNYKALKDYYGAIEDGRSPVDKGLHLTRDDTIRAAVIKSLMCNFAINKSVIEARFGIVFDDYFSVELGQLAQSDLVSVTQDKIALHDQARLLVRVVAMTFDAYMSKAKQKRFSKVI